MLYGVVLHNRLKHGAGESTHYLSDWPALLCMHSAEIGGQLARLMLGLVLLQDMDNIASVFTHKTWQTKGFKAATKSMFKSRVNFTKPATRTSRASKLPAVPEGSAASTAAADGSQDAYVGRAGMMASNSQQALLSSADSSADGSADGTRKATV